MIYRIIQSFNDNFATDSLFPDDFFSLLDFLYHASSILRCTFFCTFNVLQNWSVLQPMEYI